MMRLKKAVALLMAIALVITSAANVNVAAPAKALNETRVYFYNSEDWDKAYAYIWGASENDPLGGWPGTIMTEDSNGWYYIDVDVSPAFNIIFNNNNGSQADSYLADSSKLYYADGSLYESKEAAEAALGTGGEEKTKVYFYNKDNWNNVSAYIWGASENDPLGGWPGTAMTEDGNGWYYVEVGAEPAYNIIFNGDGGQSDGYIADNSKLYYADGNLYESKEAAEAALGIGGEEKTKVYFYNKDNWNNVSAYIWGASENDPLGGWPGTAMTEDGNGWYYVEVGAEPAYNIIFNGDGGQSDGYIADNSKLYYADGNLYESKEAAEAALGIGGEEKTKVYFYNKDNWNNVSAYIWGASENDPLGGWPGTAMTEDGNGWYYVEVGAEPAYNIIFNGDGGQSDGYIADNSKLYYADGNLYESKEAAEAALGIGGEEKTKVYFYNKDNWNNVSAYIWGASENDPLGGWPGTAMTEDGNGWYYVEVGAEPAYNIIFNGDGGQSDGYIADTSKLYYADGSLYASKEEAEAAVNPPVPEKTRIYFYNSYSWSNVNAYIWGASENDPLGGWSGAAMTADGDGWYYVDTDVKPAFNVIFNDGGSGRAETYYADSSKMYFAKGELYSSKEAAKDAIGGGSEEKPSNRVYFYNSNNWSSVYAYIWGASNGEALGSWPGVKAAADSNGWYYVDVPVSPAYNIIFNDGGNGSQAGGVYIDDSVNVYTTVKADGKFAGKSAAEASIGGNQPVNPSDDKTTVWFYNCYDWSDVYAYTWDGPGGETFGGWPGSRAVRDGNTKWYYVTLNTKSAFNIIFNNGGTAQAATQYVENGYNYITPAGKYTSKSAAEAASNSGSGSGNNDTSRVYFLNSIGWNNVYGYVWGAAKGEALGAWPGTKATHDSGNWYYIDVPSGTPYNMIFNNGEASQTGGVYIEDNINIYTTYKADSKFSTKSEAEASLGNIKTDITRVHFYNSEGWANVQAYIWGAVTTDPLGPWPGAQCVQEGDSRWWYIDVAVDLPFNIIFNSGTGAQAEGSHIADNTNVYVTVAADSAYSSKSAAESSVGLVKPMIGNTTTVWFYNSMGWDDVYAYVWGAAKEDPLGAWPGTKAVRDGNTDWWYIKCDFSIAFNIIFNNGNGAQAGGAYIDDNYNIYVTIEADGKYSSKEAAEKAAANFEYDDDAVTVVWFYNSEGWGEVYAYIWGSLKAEPLGAWPGTKCTRESADSYWYYIECPCDVPFNIIFNNNADQQTNGVYIDDKINIYTTINDDAKFASKEEAEATISEVKEIVEVISPSSDVSTTIWYYNSKGWDNVYAYITDAGGNELYGAWPGVKMIREGITSWYYLNVTADYGYTVMFNDGADNKSAEYKIENGDNVYFDTDKQYGSKKEIEELYMSDAAEASNEAGDKKKGINPYAAAGGSIAVLVIIGGAAAAIASKKKRKQK